MNHYISSLLTAIVCFQLSADQPSPKAKDFYGVWIEERREEGEKIYTNPFDLFGYEIRPDEAGCWLRRTLPLQFSFCNLSQWIRNSWTIRASMWPR